ncbi:MAG: Acb2/Tad1 domain-containing protein [Caulobacteraceae bacterium]
MPDVFAGAADGRQSTKLDEPTSRFRPRYRALTDAEKALHDAIKAKATELEELFEQVKPGRYRALGMTALEESVMWTAKELTS